MVVGHSSLNALGQSLSQRCFMPLHYLPHPCSLPKANTLLTSNITDLYCLVLSIIQVESYNVYTFVFVIFHLTFLSDSTIFYVAAVHLPLLLYSILLYNLTRAFLCRLQLIDMCVILIFYYYE